MQNRRSGVASKFGVREKSRIEELETGFTKVFGNFLPVCNVRQRFSGFEQQCQKRADRVGFVDLGENKMVEADPPETSYGVYHVGVFRSCREN